MPLSFTANRRLAEFPEVRRKVLVTGAGGNIGSAFAEANAARHDLRLMVLDEGEAAHPKTSGDLHGFGEVVVADVTDLAAMKSACAGVDTVLHLAGQPSPDATWSSLLPTNITGTYNAFVAAKSAGCRRVVFASSIHAVSGYPPDVQVKPGDPVNPGDLYGVSKCFGEALARYMAEQEGLSAICVRIGAFQPEEKQHDPERDQPDRRLRQPPRPGATADQVRRGGGPAVRRLPRPERRAASSGSTSPTAREILGYAPAGQLRRRATPSSPSLGLEKVISHSSRDGYAEVGHPRGGGWSRRGG